jgi:hypothetical protein
MQFPVISGQDLMRRAVVLPSALEGRLNLVLVAFQRWHQGLIASWLVPVAELEERYPGLRHYEIPVLPRMNLFSRTFINEGMRAGIPDPATRAATVTLYVDRVAFMKRLELPGDHTIYALLLDPQGNVLWRAAGVYSPQAGVSLDATLAARVAEPQLQS